MNEYFITKAKEVFGEEYTVTAIERLLGGAQKHSYVAKCENGFCFVIYEWSEDTTYFEYDSEAAVFRSSSAALFEQNNQMFVKNGVQTPKLYYMDRSRREKESEFAFVEYIDGVDMDYLMEKQPERLPEVVESLTESINKLHSIKKDSVGQLDRMQKPDFQIQNYFLEGIEANAAFLIENDAEYRKYYEEAKDMASLLAKRSNERKEYTFIHSELGPNHVMVDQKNQAYLIDIEGAKFSDVEEEDSFLQMRFDNQLKGIKDVVEEDRMSFYHLVHCFSNLRGAIELKQKGYYDMDDLNGMIAFFHGEFEELIRGGLHIENAR